MNEIHNLPDDAAAHYASVLADVAEALPSSFELAEERLVPIAGEVWMGNVTLHGKTGPGASEHAPRRVSSRTRAAVFQRDGFRCTYCGGPTVPRCVLVAFSDLFPDAFPYYAHYRRGTVHPAYWALAPEADHTVAHANGGSSEIENLTTLHVMCNTRKSNLDAAALPLITTLSSAPDSWDGLMSRYADVVIAGDTHGSRHSAAGYHVQWLKNFGRVDDAARVRASTTIAP